MKNCEKKGHEFEARYDENPNTHLGGMEVTRTNPKEIRKYIYYKTYIHDICVRCGKVIKKGDKENA